ncbi:hypothetical protein V1478_005313 [Vespula squamosa]|uniref:Uncharacterized protein n=1 Tax=Vespula squamosa TaxID=30214 RepID=A0ABD2BDZ1_VESSQ
MISNPGPTPRLFPDGLTKIKDVHIENLRKVQCSSMATLPLDFQTGNEPFYREKGTYGIPWSKIISGFSRAKSNLAVSRV